MSFSKHHKQTYTFIIVVIFITVLGTSLIVASGPKPTRLILKDGSMVEGLLRGYQRGVFILKTSRGVLEVQARDVVTLKPNVVERNKKKYVPFIPGANLVVPKFPPPPGLVVTKIMFKDLQSIDSEYRKFKEQYLLNSDYNNYELLRDQVDAIIYLSVAKKELHNVLKELENARDKVGDDTEKAFKADFLTCKVYLKLNKFHEAKETLLKCFKNKSIANDKYVGLREFLSNSMWEHIEKKRRLFNIENR